MGGGSRAAAFRGNLSSIFVVPLILPLSLATFVNWHTSQRLDELFFTCSASFILPPTVAAASAVATASGIPVYATAFALAARRADSLPRVVFALVRLLLSVVVTVPLRSSGSRSTDRST
jgi:hypothetical protein